MKKAVLSLSAALLLGGGLAGCNADNNEAIDNNNDTRPIGYYTNEDGRDNDLGINDRDNGQGPMTDMFDGDNNDAEGLNDDRDARNGDVDILDNDENGRDLVNDNDDFTNDDDFVNDNNGTPDDNFYNNANGEQAERIANRVATLKNVEDASVIVTDDNVIVGVETKDQADRDLRQNIRNTVRTMVDDNKDVHVTLDPDLFDRIQTVDDDLQEGRAMNEVQADIEGILEDIGNAVQRPFEDNARD